MGQQIIKQPNGKYAIYSSIIDAFVFTDATRQDIIDEFVAAERIRLEGHVNNICDELDRAGHPYHQFTMSWEEAVAEHEQRHGPLTAEKLKGDK